MKRSHRAAIFSIGAALALVAAFCLMPSDAFAAAGALSGARFAHMHFADLVVASPALLALRTAATDLEGQATATLAKITPDLDADALRAIETEYDGLMGQLETARGQIRALETAPAPTPAPGAQPAADPAAALRVERARSAEILDLGQRSGMAQADILAALSNGTDVAVFRARAFDVLAARSEAQPRTVAGNIQVLGADDDQKRGEAMEIALLHRFDPAGVALTDHARQFRGMTLLEMGSECLAARGFKPRGMSKNERAQAMLSMRSDATEHAMRSGGMLSTSDFSNVLANVATKTLRAGYQAAPQTFRPLVRVVTVPDFKPISRVQLGEAPQLEKVNEHGEFTRGKMGDAAERYAVSTYGKIVGITRQVIINDDLDAFTRIPRAFGVAAANLESDLVWGQIIANAAMGDGIALFHADHKNVGAGATLSGDAIGTARENMRMQTGLDGKTLLNVSPTYLIVPVALETATEKLLGQIYPTKTADVVTESMRKLVPISEPRLDGNSKTTFYLAASPGQIDVIELAYLEGQEGLYTETRMGFDVDGVEVKVRQDVGAKAIDHRGLWRSA